MHAQFWRVFSLQGGGPMKYSKKPLTFEEQADRLLLLLEEKHPNIPIRQMGFPDNWKDSPIWSI